MWRWLTGLMILLALAALTGTAAAADKAATARYQTLLAAAQAGEQPVDWQALRFAYADAEGGGVMSRDEAKKKMFEAYQRRDYKTAVEQAKKVAAGRFVDPDPHLIASFALAALGDEAASKREHDIAIGLLQSIQTGDGASAATAFTVINVEEEYSLMRARQRQVTRQALVSQDGHSYDVLDTVASDGDAKSFWFQIDRVMAAEAAMLGLAP